MAILMNDATGANISILRLTNELFGVTQKRVASGKKVFGAIDDAELFRTSETLLGRATQIDTLNANIALGLSQLDATDKTLTQMISLVQQAADRVSAAQNAGTVGSRSTTSPTVIAPTTTVTGAVIGSRLSITSDGGRNFTYTFNSTTVTWGEIANALNAANIGVQADFVQVGAAGQYNLVFRSSNDKDFTFDGTSDENVMDDLAGLTSPNGQGFFPANIFANGIALPGGAETGFTVGYGGQVVGNAGGGVTGATAVAAGSSMVFVDGLGTYRTLTYGAATTVSQVMTDINALGAGIKAELVNQSGGAGGPLQLRLRNLNGGDMKIVSASGDFALAGALGLPGPVTGFAATLSTDNTLRLSYGQQYDDIIAALDALITNNPVPPGRNLLQGNRIDINLDEFVSDPIKIVGTLVSTSGNLTMTQQGATWVNDLNITTSGNQVRQAESVLRGLQAQFAAFTSYIKARYTLNQGFQSELKTQGDEIVAADISEESAALTALQTRQQFAVQSVSIANQNAQAMLRLFGG